MKRCDCGCLERDKEAQARKLRERPEGEGAPKGREEPEGKEPATTRAG
ncbi:MAG: hypothetical protein Kow0092_29390 [Deferrisomatales bacterium]